MALSSNFTITSLEVKGNNIKPETFNQFQDFLEFNKQSGVRVPLAIAIIHHWLKHAYFRPPDGPGYLKAISQD